MANATDLIALLELDTSSLVRIERLGADDDISPYPVVDKSNEIFNPFLSMANSISQVWIAYATMVLQGAFGMTAPAHAQPKPQQIGKNTPEFQP